MNILMAERQLVQLFHSCDKAGSGRIGAQEFRNLCAEFEICATDSDAIFSDLDHDGDGQVSLDDFAWGFRDFLNPNSVLECTKGTSLSNENSIALMERRKSDARLAWSHLVDGIGQPAVLKFLNTSGKKLEQLYHELQNVGSSPELVTHFERALSSLLEDVKHLYDDNQKLEQMFNRERETHLKRLRGLEEELDAQVAKVEAEAREEAKLKFEQEKKEITEKMEAEMAELQAHLRLFQKVNSILSEKREENSLLKHDAAFENRKLRSTLADTRTNLALVHSELAGIKAEYESKCRELNNHQETVMQFIGENNHVQKQLSLLQEANRNLQDTNDGLLSVIESSGGRTSPYCRSQASSDDISTTSECHKRNKNSPCSAPSSENAEIEIRENDIPDDQRIANINTQFSIQRFMEDIDSGRSTLQDPIDCESGPKSLQDEFGLSDAESMLKSVSRLESGGSKYSYSLTRRSYTSKTTTDVKPSNSNNCLICCESTAGAISVDPDRSYKIVFAGDAAVGKSCFIHRFCKGIFTHQLGSTLGVDFQIKTIRVDEKNVALQLWDTAGQERFRSMTKTYFRRADGVVLLYDVTSEKSFLNVRQWLQSINETSDKEIPILICGNKIDLKEESKNLGINLVATEYGQNLADSYGALFYETSSKTGKNIPDAILAISREMLLKEDLEIQTSSLRVTKQDKKMSVCCA